jgi:multidrug efflux pump subunit AcrB
MNSLIEWFAKNGVAANLLAIFIVIVGFMTIGTLRQEVFPEFSSDRIYVRVIYPGAAPEEVEEGISQKIEEAIHGLTDVKKVTSTSQENSGTVMVELNPGTDAARALDEIKTRIDAIDTFPEESEKPLIEEIIMRKQVINVAVSGEASEKTLRHYASEVRDQLMALDGITQVELANVREMELSIEVSEDTLRKYSMTFDELAMAIRKSSVDLPGGSIKVNQGGEVLLRTKGQAKEVLDFEQIVLRTLPDGTRLRLGQVATVIDGFEENDRESYFNGDRCALVKVFRVGDENAIEISEIVQQYIKDSAHLFPEGIHLTTWQDDSVYLAGRRDLMIRNGVTGFCLVFMVLALFLRFRLAFWVSLGIPISFLGTFWLMPSLDVSISMISLFAFIVVLGIVVDDAILIGENIHAHHERGTPGLKGSIAGAIEMAKPVSFAVATSIAAFAPLIFVAGNTGKIMKFIPLIVIPTLFFSLIESLFILPKHLSHLRRVDNLEEGKGFVGAWRRFQHRFVTKMDQFVIRIYKPTLRWCLEWRYLTMAMAVAVFMITMGLVGGGHVRFTFFPPVEGDNVAAAVTMPLGTTTEETRRAVEKLKQAADEVRDELDAMTPEGHPSIVRHTLSSVGGQPFMTDQSRSGGSVASSISGAHTGEVHIEASPSEVRKFNAYELANRWREKIGAMPEAEKLQFTADIFQAGDAINVVLTGANFDELQAAAEWLKAKLNNYDEVIDIADSFRVGKEEIQLSIKPEAETLGLTQIDLARQVRSAFYGEEVQRIQRGRDDVRVMLRYPRDERRSLANLENMRIRMPGGTEIPFNEVAQVTFGRGYESIRRIDRRRAVNVTADVDLSKGNTHVLNTALKSEILPELRTEFPGVYWGFEGEQSEQAETIASMSYLYGIALIIIYGLLAIPFSSYIQPIIVMAAIPFGLIGAIWGHVVMGMDVTILSGFGVVALTGVVVNDSLVMVDYVNRKRGIGLSEMESARQAGISRFRPIILTSLTTFAGLTPLLLEKSLQAKFLVPMGVSLGFGVIFATFITLILVPSMYLILEDVRTFFFGPEDKL